jgi:hypothetical protein
VCVLWSWPSIPKLPKVAGLIPAVARKIFQPARRRCKFRNRGRSSTSLMVEHIINFIPRLLLRWLARGTIWWHLIPIDASKDFAQYDNIRFQIFEKMACKAANSVILSTKEFRNEL